MRNANNAMASVRPTDSQAAVHAMPESLLNFVLTRAAFSGLLALVGTVIALRQSARFRRSGYWWWLGGAFCIALVMPFAYMAITSYNISYTDAVLLRQLHAGSWRVAEGYAMFGGVLIARIFYLATLRRPNG
jgi:hypothetical protein